MKYNKVLITFLLKAGALYVLWHLFYQQYLEKEGTLIKRMATQLAYLAVSALNSMGYNLQVAMYNGYYSLISEKEKGLVWIDSGCTGITLMALFAGFIVAFPGPWVKKLWFIPAGIVVIYIINLLRIMLLVVHHIDSYQVFQANHKYTYVLVTYAAIFGLWMIWANRLSGLGLGRTPAASAR
jgi:exosortase family protein XrtF